MRTDLPKISKVSTPGRKEHGRGVMLPKILIIDTATGDRSTAVRVGPRGDLGPAFWSPDGARIAYRLIVYPVDPAKVHPGPHGDRRSHLCVLDLRTGHTRCFPDLRRVDGFD